VGRRALGWLGLGAACALLGAAVPASAQNYEILDERLDDSRHGYTVVRVWGSHAEMGHAMGSAFAQDIVDGLDELETQFASSWATLRVGLATTEWRPPAIEDELDGIVAGVREVLPSVDLDKIDLKILNTFSDWSYVSGCRSHTCSGQFVAAPVQTLSTRRLDYSTPFPMALHHVLCAWDPDDGSPRWVNLSWPGYVTVITAVNAYGTISSLHDFGAGASTNTGLMPRSVAARHILTGMGALPLAEHRAWATAELASANVATSSFINYYLPGGQAGVFTCTTGGPCADLRTAQPDYFGGDVLITTNTQTEGHSVPSGGEFMDAYYAQGGVKDLAGHFGLMGTDGLHLMSVEIRGAEDMTIWAHGRGRSDRLELEWAALFANAGSGGGSAAGGSAPTGGAGGAGAGAGASATGGAGPTGPTPPNATGPRESSSCGCRVAGGGDGSGSSLALLLGIASALAQRRRSRARLAGPAR
jgi:hypothetical protein